MKPPPSLHLTSDERETLATWASAVSTDPACKGALRASIVLAAAEGLDPSAIARRLHVRPSTVCKWLDRFVQERLAGLHDRARSGAPRRISAAHHADVVLRTLEPTPPGAKPWSRRAMARVTGLSRSTIHRIWGHLDIAPARRAPT